MKKENGVYFNFNSGNKFTGFIEVKAFCSASKYDRNYIYVKSGNSEVLWRVSKEVSNYINDNGNREYTLYCVGGFDIDPYNEKTAFIVMYARII